MKLYKLKQAWNRGTKGNIGGKQGKQWRGGGLRDGLTYEKIQNDVKVWINTNSKCLNALTSKHNVLKLHYTNLRIYLNTWHSFNQISPSIKKIFATQNFYIFTTWWCKPLINITYLIWSNRIYGLQYLRYTKLCCKDIGIRKSEFAAKIWISFFTELSCIWTSISFWKLYLNQPDLNIDYTKKILKRPYPIF